MDETDSIHTKMMESESLLEAFEKRIIRSINLKHGHYPCPCVAQTVWYPEKSNPYLIEDVEEIRNSCDRVIIPSIDGNRLRNELDASTAMGRGKREEKSSQKVKNTYNRNNTLD